MSSLRVQHPFLFFLRKGFDPERFGFWQSETRAIYVYKVDAQSTRLYISTIDRRIAYSPGLSSALLAKLLEMSEAGAIVRVDVDTITRNVVDFKVNDDGVEAVVSVKGGNKHD